MGTQRPASSWTRWNGCWPECERRENRGGAELFVDVVNLSFGWYRGKDDTEFPAEKHRELLDGLAAEGVRVVASAGNRSTTKPVYPAAFADELVGSTPTPTPLLTWGHWTRTAHWPRTPTMETGSPRWLRAPA